MNKGKAINIGKYKINVMEWYIPHYTPSLDQYRILMKQIVEKTPTQLRHPERSVFMKEVKTQNFWLLNQEGIIIPIWSFTVFRQSDKEHDQSLNNDTFFRLPVTSAQCLIGTKRYPHSATFLKYDDDDYSQGNGQTKKALRALTHDNILQTCIL